MGKRSSKRAKKFFPVIDQRISEQSVRKDAVTDEGVMAMDEIQQNLDFAKKETLREEAVSKDLGNNEGHTSKNTGRKPSRAKPMRRATHQSRVEPPRFSIASVPRAR